MNEGRIIDDKTKKPIPFVNVFLSDISGKPIIVRGTSIGAASNQDGYYKFDSPFTSDYITASAVGYETLTLSTKSILNLYLKPKSYGLAEVEIIASRIKKLDPKKLIILSAVLVLALLIINKYF